MRPLRTFTIEPDLPEELSALGDIARNLWWCWHGEALELFRRLDSQLWEECGHNPMAMLGRVDQNRLVRLAGDDGFLAHLLRVSSSMEYYMTNRGWWAREYGPSETPQVAYFSAEFGLTECLPIYSGGLGVLSGDHMKSASDLNIPLIGVGLLYQQGYFRQRLNADGWQLELYPRNDFHNMPVEPVTDEAGQPVIIEVPFPDRAVLAQVWRIRVGRIDMHMLDTNVPANSPADRQITAQLYGGDQELRIRQEIVLGVGGVIMLDRLGIKPKAFHMNEGHSAFLSLERIRQMMHNDQLSFDEAREAVMNSSVFTTHTPVPAGNDAFEPCLIEKYFSHYWGQLGLNKDQFLNLGRPPHPGQNEPLSMTILALRMSRFCNGVSLLHSDVSRKMWSSVWPTLPSQEVPIKGITNGIHTLTWISHDIASLFDRYLGPGWHEEPGNQSIWDAARHIPDAELWRTHERRRERLVAFCRQRMEAICRRRGAGASEIAAAEELLDPEALTIGFARRFATYKRANLLLADLDRLGEILSLDGRKVQIIFAGKAHPRDNPGKDLIRQIVHTSRQDPFKSSLLFLEDYDMNVARYLVQGCDVWLNTPLRPMEASGTSGMKVSANGGLNLSIPDGWWAEGYSPDVGWSIGSGEEYDDLQYQNAVESQALYDLLEKEVIPTFYDRGNDNLPRRWIAMMKEAIAQLAPAFNTHRMVQDYAREFYRPAVKAWESFSAENFAATRQQAQWKQTLREKFQQVTIDSVQDTIDEAGASVGQPIGVDAHIRTGELSTDDLSVELFYGELDDDGQLAEGESLPMHLSDREDQGNDGVFTYTAEMPCDRSGVTGYTVRVMPAHGAHEDTRLCSLVRWA
jgi:glycogen phosphorylase